MVPFCMVLLVIGVAVVSAIGSDLQQLPFRTNENLNEEFQPLVVDSNMLSTDGYIAYAGQFPYHARLFINNGVDSSSSVSAGSLITANYILTQAHDLRWNMEYVNMRGYALLGVDYGSQPELQQQINFTKGGVRLHPVDEIATIRLDHPVTFNRCVQPIRLPRLSDARTYELMEGTNVGSFFGASKYVRNQVMSNDACNQQHPVATAWPYHVCTNAYVGGAFCNRVYGSGLVVEDEEGPLLVAITTSIYWCAVNHPTMYIRVSGFSAWISMNSDYVFDV